MGLRIRSGFFHYRFKYKGREYAGNTGIVGKKANKKAAQAVERSRMADVRGESERREMPFSQAAGDFIGWCEQVQYRAKPQTARKIKSDLSSVVLFFADTPVSKISAGRIDEYKQWRVTEHQVRDVTLRHNLHSLSLFFGKYAVRRGLAEFNPLSRAAREAGKGVEIPSDADAIRMHPLSEDEERIYFERAFAIKDKRGLRNLYDLAKLMLNQGARPEELLASPKAAFAGATLQILKGKSRAARRTLHLTEESREILEARMSTPGPWLFPNDKDCSKHMVKLNGSHDSVCDPDPTLEDAHPKRLEFTIYDFRHTFATRCAKETDPFTLAAIMGHANLRSIMKYVHVEDETRKTAMKNFEAARLRSKLKVVG